MKLLSKRQIPRETCYDLSVGKNKNFFANGVLVHNTNAAIVFEKNNGFYCQSRERIISVGSDNAGSAAWANSVSEEDWSILRANFPADWQKVVVYGEWAGTGIQKNVAISTLPKAFYIFASRLISEDGEKEEWLDTRNWIFPPNIYNIYNYPTFKVDINFESPEYAIAEINKWVLAIGDECPVGKAHGVSGVGEGLVIRCVTEGWESSRYWFKAKDSRHSNSKITKLATVDIEKYGSEQAFIAAVLDEGRLEQGYNWLKENGKNQDQSSTGDFIRWIFNDVIKECSPEMEASGIEEKNLGKLLSGPAKKWYFARLNKIFD